LSGSGPHGRIVKKHIEKLLQLVWQGCCCASSRRLRRRPLLRRRQGPSDDMVLKLFEEGSYEELPHDGMRKTIAKRLTESKQTIPHFYVSVDCELDALLALRES
jgi:pyruvate dehydrogenase E2 component (dihydrolipoamide acetyltransferase)